MKKHTNCPNCGAPLEIDKVKCSYCGTIYYDLSAIDFNSNEPIFLTIKKDNMLLTQKVLPQTVSLIASSDETYITDQKGNRIISYTNHMNVETNITFVAVPDEHNNIIEVTKNG